MKYIELSIFLIVVIGLGYAFVRAVKEDTSTSERHRNRKFN